MAKKKIQKTNAIRLLEQKKIAYSEREFPVVEGEHTDATSVANYLGESPKELFKTLITVGNKTGPVVAVIPGDSELDLKKLAKSSGNKKMEMLPLKELEATTGYVRGGCSPVGMKKLYPTYIDETSLNYDQIHVSAGKRGLQMSVSAKSMGELVKATFTDLTIN